MMSVKKLKDELEYWIMIGIADDIVTAPNHRPEYQHLVSKYKKQNLDREAIIINVLNDLQSELKKHTIFRPTFWRLLIISIKDLFKR